MAYTRNQLFEVVTVCHTTLQVVAMSVERVSELVEKAGYLPNMARHIGNAARGQAEGICE